MNSPSQLFIAAALFVALVGGCSKSKSSDADGDRTTIDVWATETSVSARIAKLLAPREVPAEVLITRLPEEVEKVAAKLVTAAELDPRTFLTLVRDGAKKGPPPYDRRLGISKSEYEVLTTARWELTKRADVVLKIVQTGEDRISITGLPDMKELAFEPSVQRVITPYGDLFRPEPFESSATQQTAAMQNGYIWHSPAFGDALARFQLPEILLGQSSTGDAWLKLTVDDTIDDRRIIDYFVRFSGPPK